jgi:sigma-B regulation protein RsbU (phosphoserine phosphatase)
MESVGLPLGLFDDPTYDEVAYGANDGDVFVFFSDGVTDAQNRNDDQFGGKRLAKVIEANCGRSADDIVTAIFTAVAEFTAGEKAYDDQTVVVLKVLGTSGKSK